MAYQVVDRNGHIGPSPESPADAQARGFAEADPSRDLSGEAIRLGRLIVDLLPEAEAIGLLALMLLHESRRATRTSARSVPIH